MPTKNKGVVAMLMPLWRAEPPPDNGQLKSASETDTLIEQWSRWSLVGKTTSVDTSLLRNRQQSSPDLTGKGNFVDTSVLRNRQKSSPDLTGKRKFVDTGIFDEFDVSRVSDREQDADSLCGDHLDCPNNDRSPLQKHRLVPKVHR
jgi:hypothetical protein